MERPLTVDFPTPGQAPIRANFFDRGASELAVVFPGLRYTCEMPLLSAVADVFTARQTNLLTLSFSYDLSSAFANASEEEQLDWIGNDGAAILDQCRAMRDHRRLWIIGKSLGTISMAWPIARDQDQFEDAQLIWLTPSLLGTPLLDKMTTITHRSLVVLGSRDPANQPHLLQPLISHTAMSVRLIDGVDHGFGHVDGLTASARAVGETVSHIAKWIEQGEQTMRRD